MVPCLFLPDRLEYVQLSSRTGSALLQMSGQPFRGSRLGCEAQCRGYKVRMKGDFVPYELLQKTLITQRSGVTHSLCTSAITPTCFFFFLKSAAAVGNDVSPLTMKAFEKQHRPARRDGSTREERDVWSVTSGVWLTCWPPCISYPVREPIFL